MKKPNEPIKQTSTGDHLSLLAAVICPADALKRLLVNALLFSLLMIMLSAVGQTAFAQGSVNTGKNGPGSTQVDTGATASGARGTSGPNGYFARFPYAQAAQKNDTTHKDDSTGVQASDAGQNSPPQTAYNAVIKMCEEGYGIAYQQTPMIATDKPAAKRDGEVFQNLMTTFGYPMSDSQFQIISRENNQRLLELAFDPERVMWMTSATSQTTSSQVSKSMANTGELALNAVFQYIVNGDGTGSMINVANEGAVAGLAYRGNGDDISVAQAVSMVQVMYKQVFIPMAVLFLLPGAVISQVKSITAKGFGMQATESQSPFDGILRSIVAVFLIPATQVIVSWSIDTGNSLAYSCREWVDLQSIQNWTESLCYDPKKKDNAILPPNPSGGSSGGGGGGGLSGIGGSIGGAIGGSVGAAIGSFLGGILGGALGGYAGIGDGLAANQPEAQSTIEQQDWMGQALQTTLNGAMLMAAITLIVMTALQVVTMCYLLLLGPISAAFYAWPQVSSTHLFRGVFGKWVDGVIKVSMWRFVWMAILAIMTQRIIYMGGMPTDLRWECAVMICFLGLMVGVPASPFTFQPYAAFQSARQLQTQSATTQASGTAGGPSSQSGSPGASSAAGNSSPAGSPQGTPVNSAPSPGSSSDSGTQSPTGGSPSPSNAGGSGEHNSKDGPSTAPPPNAKPGGEGSGSAPGGGSQPGTPAGPAGGSPSGSTPPPGTGGAPAGATPAAPAGAPSGATPPPAPAGSMPSGSPAVPLSPGAPGGGTQVIKNPGAPAAPPAAPAAPAPAPAPAAAEGGGDTGKKGGGSKSGGGGAAPAGGTADTGGAAGQIAGQISGTQPPPPSNPGK